MGSVLRTAVVGLHVIAGCGRMGFDPQLDGDRDAQVAVPGDGGSDATAPSDGGPDAAMPMIGCVDRNLGSALGPDVSSGTTVGEGNDYLGCSGDGPELSFGWFAPATATYRIDTCASDQSFDSVLYVRDGSCTGTQLACNDDACGGGIGVASRVTVSLTAGQGIVIIVDGLFTGGDYQLAITQL